MYYCSSVPKLDGADSDDDDDDLPDILGMGSSKGQFLQYTLVSQCESPS